VKILAEAFRGKSRVEQHRMVNAALAEELHDRVHALAIQAGPPAALVADELKFSEIPSADARLRHLLTAAQLPVNDLDTPTLGFIGIVTPEGELIACGGLEMRGDAALIRSIAVTAFQRKSMLGTTITFKLLAEARNRGAQAAYLLTATAQDFFSRLGFTAIDRSKVPAPIAATSQFTGQTCASAQAMVSRLRS
jgi:N-acetylglutamate synthase-like GNAT family acetyltransferase